MRYLLAMLALATLCLLSTKLLYSQDLLPAPKPPAPPKAFLQLSDQDANRGSTTRISLSDQPASEKEDAPDDKDIEQDSEGESQTNSEGEGTEDDKENGDSDSEEDSESEKSSNNQRRNSRRRSRFSPQLVERGRVAFEDSCTQCHDAERSTSKRKSRASWLSTVRRMARLDGAEIETSDFVPIATYLASLSAPAGSMQSNGGNGVGDDSSNGEDGDESMDGGDEDFADEDLALDDSGGFGSGLNISSTISTLYRGGNDNLENPGFFVDAWVRADFQPSGPIRGRVTTCTSCHSDQTNDGGFTLELVEATAHLDLLHWLKERCPPDCQPRATAEIKAGRFVVPFGAFASMSHPGVYRTVTNPLMYNMGRQVNADRQFVPVLPAPYSDEGVDLYGRFPLHDKWNLTIDAYAVNGLQGSGSGIQYTPSRSYTDNNNELAVGGRATIGNGKIRFGGSIMSGRMQADGSTPLKYKFVGADMTARLCDDQVRLYFEYAIRDNETSFPENQVAYGVVSEIELLLLDDPNLSLLGRYDTLEHRNFFDDTSIERFTWGLSTTAIGGSLFMINHEHWNFPTGEKDVDVFGFRWVATF